MTINPAKKDKTRLLVDTRINGKPISISVKPGRRLIDLLREDLHLMGTKEGCGEGECGSCTVILNGDIVLSCLVPIERAIGAEIVTIEGIGTPQNLHPLQKALIEEGGVQCGMCTPGIVIAGINLLQNNPNPSREEIVDGIAGNLCRCTGYQKIISAIERAASREE